VRFKEKGNHFFYFFF